MAGAPLDLLARADARGVHFRSLLREYDTSAETFESEFALIFSRQWLLVGHPSQIPDPGDYFTIDLSAHHVPFEITKANVGSLGSFEGEW